ncbi:hypothetical protein Zmor_004647 [Zophobas morio]|uniref:Uncharacterized protein n=1 Tax=Zophobas morio TaxID=2755281 RepID=A0AA38IND2_9CUCU|nr:hypothetical protein Zmor_004647 [Zophobas morio]
MATEVENNAPPAEAKEIKEDAPAADAKAEEAAKQEAAAADAAKEKEPAPPKVLVHKANYDKDVVYLYQFSRTPLLPSLSPFCLKVESWLRLAAIKYEVCCSSYLRGMDARNAAILPAGTGPCDFTPILHAYPEK